jgi:hypothetical protein
VTARVTDEERADRFLADMRMPTENDILSNVKMVSARACCMDMSRSDFEFAASFSHLLKGHHLSVAQALELLNIMYACVCVCARAHWRSMHQQGARGGVYIYIYIYKYIYIHTYIHTYI